MELTGNTWQEMTNVQSIFTCQQLCHNDTECKHWSWKIETDICILIDDDEVVKSQAQKTLSGNKDCVVQIGKKKSISNLFNKN